MEETYQQKVCDFKSIHCKTNQCLFYSFTLFAFTILDLSVEEKAQCLDEAVVTARRQTEEKLQETIASLKADHENQVSKIFLSSFSIINRFRC